MLIRIKTIRYWSIFLVLIFGVVGGIGNMLTFKNDQVIRNVSITEKVVAITIDDGPHPVTTPKILAVLREKQVKATFFCLGRNVMDNKNIVRQIALEGHEIGNHGFSHTLITKFSAEKFRDELEQSETLLASLAAKPTLFRPPGGAINDSTLGILRERGYQVVTWSVDPRDWSGISATQIISNVTSEARPGRIILLHDGQYPINTPEALGVIIDKLQEQGYKFVTVSQLLNMQ